MSELGDSLVIRILADSSEFQRGLDDALGRLDELRSRVEDLAGTSSQLNRLGTALGALQSPLQALGRLFDQVQRQAEALSNTSVSLNVSPALNSLAGLSAAIARVQAQLQALSMSATFPTGGASPVPLPTGAGGMPRQFAAGGPVEGPAGNDRVPALLTAGEFVLNRDAVARLGLPFLQQLNDNPRSTAGSTVQREHPSINPASVSTQFGVTVQVQQPSELGSVLDTLVLEELHLRNRRG